MEYYILLSIATIIIIVLALLIWVKTRSISFPIGIAFMYFLSVFGAWTMVADRLGEGGNRQYEYLEKKLFTIYLDEFFFWNIVFFSLFIIVVELLVLITVKRHRNHEEFPKPGIQISHVVILLISTLSGAVSYLLVKEDLATAAWLNVSPYELMKRGLGEVSPYFTIHQLLNRLALVPAMLGFIIYCSGKNPRLIAGRGGRWTFFGYLIIIGALVWLAFILGYKSDLFFPGVSAVLFYLVNAERPRIKLLVVMSCFIVMGMGLTDMLRYVSLADLAGTVWNFTTEDFLTVFRFASTNNEAYAAYFSMYGALSQDIPLTYGSSLISMLASTIPRFLWADRPVDIYSYFAESVNAVEGQGYTVHHAAGWYLNFGTIGLLFGAVLMGWIWGKFYNSFSNVQDRKFRVHYIFSSIAPWIFVAYIHAMMRAGPEVYKGLFLEGIFMPLTVLLLASYRWRLFPQSKNRR
jgi:oligosaccharide repeat unit polymerase